MARVRVPTARFKAGDLPAVCAKTGKPADGWLEVEAMRVPSWIFLLLVFGGLPALIALLFAVERVPGLVPLSAHADKWLRRGRCSRWVFLVGGLVVMCVGLISGARVALELAFALLVGAVVVYFLEAFWLVGGRLSAEGDQVVLSRIHPAFRSALRARSATEQASPSEAHNRWIRTWRRVDEVDGSRPRHRR